MKKHWLDIPFIRIFFWQKIGAYYNNKKCFSCGFTRVAHDIPDMHVDPDNHPCDKFVDPDEPLYWYAFTFVGVSLEGDPNCHASTYIGYPEKAVNLPRLQDAKRSAKVDQNAVVFNVSYLGCMTRGVMREGGDSE